MPPSRNCFTVLVASGLAVFLPGCGHPASRAECEQILDKVVELELATQNVKDAATIAERKEKVRKERGEALLPKCVGRKITDAAVACVRGATTYDQINDVCLR